MYNINIVSKQEEKCQMRGIIDIHNHILFDVDDGADSLAQSLNMLKEEYSQGVRKVIVTPHFHLQHYENEPEDVLKRFNELKEAAAGEFPNMELYLGNEIMACNDIAHYLDENCIFTMAGSRYILMEFYPGETYDMIEQSLSRVINEGYIPIVAHCERYKCFQKRFGGVNIEGMRHLIEMGAYFQINCRSVYDGHRKFVKKLIDNDLLHFVASDAHNLTTRGIEWKTCIENLTNKYNEEYLKWLLIENPEKVIQGKYI